jgi:hypothetical protein
VVEVGVVDWGAVEAAVRVVLIIGGVWREEGWEDCVVC